MSRVSGEEISSHFFLESNRIDQKYANQITYLPL